MTAESAVMSQKSSFSSCFGQAGVHTRLHYWAEFDLLPVLRGVCSPMIVCMPVVVPGAKGYGEWRTEGVCALRP